MEIILSKWSVAYGAYPIWRTEDINLFEYSSGKKGERIWRKEMKEKDRKEMKLFRHLLRIILL